MKKLQFFVLSFLVGISTEIFAGKCYKNSSVKKELKKQHSKAVSAQEKERACESVTCDNATDRFKENTQKGSTGHIAHILATALKTNQSK